MLRSVLRWKKKKIIQIHRHIRRHVEYKNKKRGMPSPICMLLYRCFVHQQHCVYVKVAETHVYIQSTCMDTLNRGLRIDKNASQPIGVSRKRSGRWGKKIYFFIFERGVNVLIMSYRSLAAATIVNRWESVIVHESFMI